MASSKCPWWALVWPLCGCFGGSSTWPFLVSSECACPQLRTLRVLDESVRSCPWGPGKKLKNPAGLGRSGTSLSLMASRRRPWCVLGCHCAAVLVYPVMVPGRAQGVLVLSCIPGASWVNPCGPVLGGREKKKKPGRSWGVQDVLVRAVQRWLSLSASCGGPFLVIPVCPCPQLTSCAP